MSMMSQFAFKTAKAKLGTICTGFFGPVEIIMISVGKIIYFKNME